MALFFHSIFSSVSLSHPFQFFNNRRLNEIFTLQAELAQQKVITKATIKILKQEDHKAKKAALRKKIKALANENNRNSSGPAEDEDSGEEAGEPDQEEEQEEGEDEGGREEEGKEEVNVDATSESVGSVQLSEEEKRNPYAIQLERLTRDVYGDSSVEGSRGKYDLPQELVQEKNQLLSEGFPDWTRSDYKFFILALEKYGKHDLASVVGEMSQGETRKIPEEVERYYSVFWKRYRELADGQKAMDRIERGQKRIDRLKSLQLSIDKKIRRHYGNGEQEGIDPSHSRHPANELTKTIGSGTISSFSCSCNPLLEKRLLVPWSLSYGNPGKGRYFIEDEDHALVLLMHRYGYGSWAEITQTLQHSLAFSFNFCLNSRSVSDVAKRCDFLLRLIEKENQLYDGFVGEAPSGMKGEGGEEESKDGLGTPAKGKRGRKRKMDSEINEEEREEASQANTAQDESDKVPKKRGRKPGKRSLPKEE